jgi:hypothetical protein
MRSVVLRVMKYGRHEKTPQVYYAENGPFECSILLSANLEFNKPPQPGRCQIEEDTNSLFWNSLDRAGYILLGLGATVLLLSS